MLSYQERATLSQLRADPVEARLQWLRHDNSKRKQALADVFELCLQTKANQIDLVGHNQVVFQQQCEYSRA